MRRKVSNPNVTRKTLPRCTASRSGTLATKGLFDDGVEYTEYDSTALMNAVGNTTILKNGKGRGRRRTYAREGSRISGRSEEQATPEQEERMSTYITKLYELGWTWQQINEINKPDIEQTLRRYEQVMSQLSKLNQITYGEND